MASEIPSHVDPATVPLSIEQPSDLFRLPRELRDKVYQFAFSATDCDRSADAATPLLTCRQFYVEGRAIAFSSIDWRIYWDQVIGPYYNGEALSSDGKPLLAQLYDQLGSPLPLQLENIKWSTRSPLDFTMSRLWARAKLSDQQRAAVRRITISNYWYDFPHGYMHAKQFSPISPRTPRSMDESSILYHFLKGLRNESAIERPLDCITFETYRPLDVVEGWEYGPVPDMQHAVRQEWSPSLAMLWDKHVTKKFILRSRESPDHTIMYRERPPNIHSTTWYMRFPLTNLYLGDFHNVSVIGKSSHQPYGSPKIYVVFKDAFNFDSDKHPQKWQWKFLKDADMSPPQADDKSFDYVEITRAT